MPGGEQVTKKKSSAPYVPSILVAEDDPETRRMLRRTLEEVGYFVFEAANGREAWKAVLERYFDLVILDLSMPEEDGIEVLRSIRSELARIKVVAVSGFLQGTFLRAARSLGAESALHKPVREEVLLPEVCRVLAARA